MHRLIPALALVLMMLLSAGGVLYFQDPNHYPWLVTEVQATDNASSAQTSRGAVKISFLGHGVRSPQMCRQQLAQMTNTLREKCPTCAVRDLDCLSPPSSLQRSYLSNEPIGVPVAVHSGGVIVYESDDLSLAVATCRQSQQAAANGTNFKCLPADSPKKGVGLIAELSALPFLAILMALAGGLAAWLTNYLLIRYEHLHAHFSHDHADSGPQKMHHHPTPRIGGISVFVGLLLVSLVLQSVSHRFGTQEFGLLVMAALPAFVVGLAEDVTKKVGVVPRLLATMAAALLGCWLLDATLQRLDIPGLESALSWLPLAMLVTAVAVGGVANAVNIIDGYNGLAGGTAFIAAAAMGWAAWWVGDPLVMSAAFALAGALLGFLAWNWPKGHIFLGDGGAYLVGFWLAELAVILVARNPEVSAWFPLVVLIYPIFETLFSISRRRRNGHSPGAPDAAHLHQLVHRHILARLIDRSPIPLTKQERANVNGRVAVYFWVANSVLAALAIALSHQTGALAAVALGFSGLYMLAYRRLSR